MRQMKSSRKLTNAGEKALTAGAEFYKANKAAIMSVRVMVEFKTGVELTLKVDPLGGGMARGGHFGFIKPKAKIVESSFGFQNGGYNTCELWVGFTVAHVEARSSKPENDKVETGNMIVADLISSTEGMGIE